VRVLLRVLKFDGAIAPRVLKFDSGSAAEGCGGRLILLKAPSYDKTFTTGLSPVGKPYNRPAGEENKPASLCSRKYIPPLVPYGTTFPRGAVGQ